MTTENGKDPLAVSPERMREMTAATVDLIAEMLRDLRGRPVNVTATAEEMRDRLAEPAPESGRPFEEALDRLCTDALPYASRLSHPAYFAFIPGAPTFPGVLGDMIAAAFNIEASSWMEAAGPSRLELTVIDWFKQWLGYPDEAEGILVSGGSAANLGALACARESLAGAMSDDLVIYASDQSHSSIARGARTLGFRPDQLRVLPVDDEYRMRPDALSGAIAADRDAGRRPLIVCVAAGSTNTGAVDPLGELADVCRDSGVWLHVDGAYGGFAALTERGRRLLSGIERADSITLDPHKWLYQPFECGCLLVRDGAQLDAAFTIAPEYLKDARGGEVSFGDRGLQLSRSARAIKLWLSIQTFGVAAFREAIDRAMDLAAVAEGRVTDSDDLELLRPARLGIICFRRRFGGGRSERELESLNRRLVAALQASGEGLVSSTRLRGTYAIRMCVLNHTTQERDVRHVLEWLERAEIEKQPVPQEEVQAQDPDADRHQVLVSGGDGHGEADVEDLRRVEALEGLDEEQLELVATASRMSQVSEGEEVTTRWGGGRDFYVILEGELTAEVDGEFIRTMKTGNFFGELAALDWGAGFGYTRLATVTATSPSRLLVVPPDLFNRLVSEAPQFGERVNAAVRERLPRS